MKALSIRQPWIYAILHLGKEVENRTWDTKYRGPLLLHAGKAMCSDDYEFICEQAEKQGLAAPRRDQIERGGIVGICDVADMVENHKSPWFHGQVGWLLKNARPLPFVPMRGHLGLFEVAEAQLLSPATMPHGDLDPRASA